MKKDITMLKMLEIFFSSLEFFECNGGSLEFYHTVGNAVSITTGTMFYDISYETALLG